MRILHVVPSFGLGGMEKIVCALINNTSACCSHEILALDKCARARDWIKGKKIRLIEFEKPEERGSFFRALYRVLQQVQPDLLMTYNWGASDAIWLGRVAGIRRVIHNEHGFNVDEARKTNWKRDLIRFIVFRLASRLIVVSGELERLLRRRYLLREGHVTRIPNGIDTSRYSPDGSERQRIRKILGFEDRDVVVGFSGRLDAIKNLGLLLGIFARCAREHDALRLLIVGDGPEKRRLEMFCQQENLRSRIVFTGLQQEVVPYLRAMDIFLLTSLREQMPMTVLEAMAVGIPVVATRVGEIPNIIEHGVNGFILDVEAPAEAFVESLRALLCPALRERMGHAARNKITSQFQEQDMVERYRRVFESLSLKTA